MHGMDAVSKPKELQVFFILLFKKMKEHTFILQVYPFWYLTGAGTLEFQIQDTAR